MEKAEFIRQVAFSFVPEGSRRVTMDVGLLAQATPMTPAAAGITGAEILEGDLLISLEDLPDELTGEHHERVTDELMRFFGGVMLHMTEGDVYREVERQCQACLEKTAVLLGQDTFDKA